MSIARFLNAYAAGHLTNNQFNVLVVDRYTLVAIHLLYFFYEVHLCFTWSLDLHKFLRIKWAFGDAIASGDVLAIFNDWTATGWQHDFVLNTLVVDDMDWNSLAFVFKNAHNTSCASQTC